MLWQVSWRLTQMRGWLSCISRHVAVCCSSTSDNISRLPMVSLTGATVALLLVTTLRENN